MSTKTKIEEGRNPRPSSSPPREDAIQAATQRIRLPFPVSVNNMFPTVGTRRVPSAAYEAWKNEVVRQLFVQRPRPVSGPVNIRIDLVAPDNRRRDADNYNKAVLDALVRHKLIEADDTRIVRRVSTEWQEEGEPCVVTITATTTASTGIAREKA